MKTTANTITVSTAKSPGTSKKAYAYLRVSGRGQLEGDGFPRQQKAIKAYAAAHGLKIVETFKEEGVSGKTELANRPALSALLMALHSNGVRTVVIERLDRLARDLGIQEAIIADLIKSGFELISTAEPDLLVDDPTRKLMRQVLGAVSEYERAMIVVKLRGARERMRTKTGRCEGAKPFGHHHGEGATLQRMKELRAEGLGFDRIAVRLTAEGRMNRVGRPWGGNAINRILSRSKVAK